jgi:hypothetical protein
MAGYSWLSLLVAAFGRAVSLRLCVKRRSDAAHLTGNPTAFISASALLCVTGPGRIL